VLVSAPDTATFTSGPAAYSTNAGGYTTVSSFIDGAPTAAPIFGNFDVQMPAYVAPVFAPGSEPLGSAFFIQASASQPSVVTSTTLWIDYAPGTRTVRFTLPPLTPPLPLATQVRISYIITFPSVA
jgi:hypothetical protein